LILIIALGYLVLSAVPSGNPRPATPIRLVSGDWKPFISPDLPDNGPLAQIVTETFQRMGYEPEITFVSWDLALEQTSRVEVLGAFPFISSTERRMDYAFSESILDFEYVLFYYAPNVPDPASLQSIEDFHAGDYQFGKVVGYDVWPALADAGFSFREYPTSLAAFQALADGEIDFLPEGRLVGEVILNGPDIAVDAASFAYLDPTGNELLGARESLYLLLPESESANRLLSRFNEELELVKQSTVYAEAQAAITCAGSCSSIVELHPVGAENLIRLVDAHGQAYFAPLGTRALVMQWPDAFSSGAASDAEGQFTVTVKVLNGPLQGRVMQVDARAVRLVP
jgi:polar amino acid transport system substrate-binding protein